jgi:Tfp pilus assembly protein PilV
VSINGQTTTSRSVTLGAAGSSTPISIIVTAPNGSQKPYSVVVNRAALGGNNNLQSLSVSPGSLSPVFNANTQDYTVNVTSDVGSVTVTAIPQDGSATVSINGQTTTSRSVTLGGVGSSTLVSIIVTAPNGSQKPYSVIVNRAVASGNAGLSSLTVSAGTLTPTFLAPGTPGMPGYTVGVLPNTVTSFTVTAVKADLSATLTISPSATVNPLPAGNTVFTIVVTAQAGNSLTYFVTVTRAP